MVFEGQVNVGILINLFNMGKNVRRANEDDVQIFREDFLISEWQTKASANRSFMALLIELPFILFDTIAHTLAGIYVRSTSLNHVPMSNLIKSTIQFKHKKHIKSILSQCKQRSKLIIPGAVNYSKWYITELSLLTCRKKSNDVSIKNYIVNFV